MYCLDIILFEVVAQALFDYLRVALVFEEASDSDFVKTRSHDLLNIFLFTFKSFTNASITEQELQVSFWVYLISR